MAARRSVRYALVGSACLLITTGLGIGLASVLSNRSHPEQPSAQVDSQTSDLLNSLKASADSNATKLRAIEELLASLRANSSASKAGLPTAAKQPASKEEVSKDKEKKAKLPPSKSPFLDYDSLPDEFLDLVGENETFMLLQDGRLARLLMSDLSFSPSRDLETREIAQDILSSHVQQRELYDSYVKRLLGTGAYTFFENMEEAQAFMKEKTKTRGTKLCIEQVPGRQGYAVLDTAALYNGKEYVTVSDNIEKLMKKIGTQSAMVFFTDPAKDAQPGNARHTHEQKR